MVKKRCGRGFEFYSHILNMADSFNGFLTEMKGGKKI